MGVLLSPADVGRGWVHNPTHKREYCQQTSKFCLGVNLGVLLSPAGGGRGWTSPRPNSFSRVERGRNGFNLNKNTQPPHIQLSC